MAWLRRYKLGMARRNGIGYGSKLRNFGVESHLHWSCFLEVRALATGGQMVSSREGGGEARWVLAADEQFGWARRFSVASSVPPRENASAFRNVKSRQLGRTAHSTDNCALHHDRT